MPTNPNQPTGDTLRPDVPAHPHEKHDSEHPGYETQDVNVFGVVYFLGGLLAFVAVFFVLCFYIGKVINYRFVQADGAPDKWHPYGATRNRERENLTPNTAMEQKTLAGMTASFPTPRLVADDDNQETADMHAREDLLLDYTSTTTDGGQQTLRIPIDQAMKLIVQRGLGSPATPITPTNTPALMAGDSAPRVTAPLTTGFARTGYELDQMETREQKMSYEHAKGKE
jgi:hypothetical protein